MYEKQSDICDGCKYRKKNCDNLPWYFKSANKAYCIYNTKRKRKGNEDGQTIF